MKSGSVILIVIGVLVGVLLLGAMWFVGTQNSFVAMRVDTEASRSSSSRGSSGGSFGGGHSGGGGASGKWD